MCHTLLCGHDIVFYVLQVVFVIWSWSCNYHILIIGSTERGRNESPFKSEMNVWLFFILRLNQQHDEILSCNFR